jgi:hypothetical protein
MAASAGGGISEAKVEQRICQILASTNESMLLSVVGTRYNDLFGSFPFKGKLGSFMEARKGAVFIHSPGDGGGRWFLRPVDKKTLNGKDALALARGILAENKDGSIRSGDLGDMYRKVTGKGTKPGQCSKLIRDHPHLFRKTARGANGNGMIHVIASALPKEGKTKKVKAASPLLASPQALERKEGQASSVSSVRSSAKPDLTSTANTLISLLSCAPDRALPGSTLGAEYKLNTGTFPVRRSCLIFVKRNNHSLPTLDLKQQVHHYQFRCLISLPNILFILHHQVVEVAIGSPRSHLLRSVRARAALQFRLY